ncbi:MAG: exodeoxyribonuclease VII large subunit [Synoicihabitans sp.]
MASWKDDLEPVETTGSASEVESVSRFTRRIKTLLERNLEPGWIQGEISNVRRQSSGHTYFVLKDAGAQLSCVLFRGDASRQTVRLADGQQVLLAGRLSVYEARGQYQLIVRQVKEDGVGRLQREFEALKARLSAEGLFERERKKPLPEPALAVAFVTSPTGAAIQDFVRIMLRRGWRGRLTVVPVKVQGVGAAAEIAAMLEFTDQSGEFDLIVVGRGGGSLEDLWAFNEEAVVRAIAGCSTPVISAVGHEIDFTLSDFAADVRAETPSGAAELISSAYASISDRLSDVRETMVSALARGLQNARGDLQDLRNRLRLLTPRGQIEQGWLRRDDMANRLKSALSAAMDRNRSRLESGRVALANNSPQRRVEFESHRLLNLWKRLQSVSPKATLNRGFAIVRDDQGQVVLRKSEIKLGERYEAEFADGQTRLRADSE